MSDYGGSLDREIDHPLLGHRVRVRLDDAGEHWLQGELMKITESGDVDIREESGLMVYAWPALEVVEAEQLREGGGVNA